MIQVDVPKLIDPSSYYFMSHILRKCHETRVYAYSLGFNILVVVLFLVFVFITLYICFHKKRSSTEQKEKLIRDQKYILDKIRSLKMHTLSQNADLFTPLPVTNT